MLGSSRPRAAAPPSNIEQNRPVATQQQGHSAIAIAYPTLPKNPTTASNAGLVVTATLVALVAIVVLQSNPYLFLAAGRKSGLS